MNYQGDLINVNDEYLRSVFYHALREGMQFPVYSMHFEKDLSDIETDKNFILMLTGNEKHQNLDHFYEDSRVVSIIKNYPEMENVAMGEEVECAYEYTYGPIGIPRFIVVQEDERTLNIPLGCCNNFIPHNISNRTILGGFIGQWSHNRGLYINNINSYFKSKGQPSPFQVGLYEGFGPFVRDDESLSIGDYSHLLSNMMSAFCFTGQSPETFRHVEAAMAGCVLISTPLPDVWYYNSIPALISYDFNPLRMDAIMSKLKTHRDELQRAASIWYIKVCSPPAVGKKVAEHIASLL